MFLKKLGSEIFLKKKNKKFLKIKKLTKNPPKDIYVF